MSDIAANTGIQNITLNRESFLRELATNLAFVNEAILGLGIAKDYTAQVGLCMGASFEEKYRAALQKTGPLTPKDYARIIVDLKQKIGGNFYTIQVTHEKVVVGSKTCPFEDLVLTSPSLCQMTSSVFGGIAARNFGYAKVVLKERIALGKPECQVWIYLARNQESEAETGDEYNRESSLVSSNIKKHILLPKVLHSLEEMLNKKTSEIQESEQKYRLLFNHIPEAAWVYDLDSLKFLDVNQTSIDRYGYSREAFLSMDIMQIRPKEDHDTFRTVIETRKKNRNYYAEGSWRHLKKDGSIIWVEVTSQYIHIDGKDARLVLSKDITSQKKDRDDKQALQEQLAQAQKMEALGTLASGVAHDFNNLLTGILGYTSLMLQNLKETDPYYHAVTTIQDSAVRASDLTKQLLGFARKGRYDSRPICVNQVIDSVLKLALHTFDKSMLLETHLQPGLKMVDADYGQIQHSLLNLCINAQNAMPSGGLLKIETRDIFLTESDIRSHVGAGTGPYVLVSVSDTGIGMNDETMKRIFDPFFTTRKESGGTGLGLAMVYGIIQNHGGFIKVSSRVEKGSTFDIYLPATERTCTPSSTKEEEPMQGGNEKILVVDDEPTLVRLSEKILTSFGYQVLTATSGLEACKILEENKDQINLVVLDFIMPGMSGEETFQRLREINPHVRVLLSSGYSREGKAKNLIEQGIQGFIQKPFVMQELADAVRMALDKEA